MTENQRPKTDPSEFDRTEAHNTDRNGGRTVPDNHSKADEKTSEAPVKPPGSVAMHDGHHHGDEKQGEIQSGERGGVHEQPRQPDHHTHNHT